MAPPRPRPGLGLGRVEAGPARSPLQDLFLLVVAAARARKRTGEKAVEAEAPPASRVAAASSTLGSAGAGPGNHASHAPGPAGRLPAGLGGAAAGLPEHPGERQSGCPLVLSHVYLARGQGSGRLVSGTGELESGVGDPGVAPEGPSSRPHLSVRRRHPSRERPPRSGRDPTVPGGLRASSDSLGKRPDPVFFRGVAT